MERRGSERSESLSCAVPVPCGRSPFMRERLTADPIHDVFKPLLRHSVSSVIPPMGNSFLRSGLRIRITGSVFDHVRIHGVGVLCSRNEQEWTRRGRANEILDVPSRCKSGNHLGHFDSSSRLQFLPIATSGPARTCEPNSFI